MEKLLFISLLFPCFCFGQNLVPNPSFEDTVQCPYDFDQIDFATGWSNYSDITPDYFNSCASTGWIDVPNNAYGSQMPATGNAYGGFLTYGSHLWNFIDLREFIGRQLSSPLVIGTKYYVSFKVSLGFVDSLRINCASNRLGILLSTAAYSTISPAPILNYAHVYTDSIVADTTNWVTISGSFTADSAYNYLVLGNFFDDNNTDTLIMNDSIYCNTYYYVDDICVSVDSLTCDWPNNISEITRFQAQITIYPNPTSSSFTIQGNHELPAVVELYDITGRQVYRHSLTSNQQEVDVSSLSEGLYLWKLSDKLGTEASGKLMKQ